MGRWAQARRTGGDNAHLTYMVSALRVVSNEANITFNKGVQGSQFALNDIISEPGSVAADGFIQLTPTQLNVSFVGSLIGQTGLRYIGDVPQLVENQSITLNHP